MVMGNLQISCAELFYFWVRHHSPSLVLNNCFRITQQIVFPQLVASHQQDLAHLAWSALDGTALVENNPYSNQDTSFMFLITQHFLTLHKNMLHHTCTQCCGKKWRHVDSHPALPGSLGSGYLHGAKWIPHCPRNLGPLYIEACLAHWKVPLFLVPLPIAMHWTHIKMSNPTQ